jgi:hypothetical protein
VKLEGIFVNCFPFDERMKSDHEHPDIIDLIFSIFRLFVTAPIRTGFFSENLPVRGKISSRNPTTGNLPLPGGHNRKVKTKRIRTSFKFRGNQKKIPNFKH